ncbi:MAG: hypothetical protein ACYTGL_17690 [Planctomycetota bacterium]|jgi:hypothetical protein
MSNRGNVIGYLMMTGGVILCLLGADGGEGGLATAGAILISTVWLGLFVLNPTPPSE